MKNTKQVLLVLASAIMLGACFHKPSEQPATSGVKSLPPVETLTDDGMVDEDRFEESQTTSDDDSLGTIEKELEETVILEEDFSDI